MLVLLIGCCRCSLTAKKGLAVQFLSNNCIFLVTLLKHTNFMSFFLVSRKDKELIEEYLEAQIAKLNGARDITVKSLISHECEMPFRLGLMRSRYLRLALSWTPRYLG